MLPDLIGKHVQRFGKLNALGRRYFFEWNIDKRSASPQRENFTHCDQQIAMAAVIDKRATRDHGGTSLAPPWQALIRVVSPEVV